MIILRDAILTLGFTMPDLGELKHFSYLLGLAGALKQQQNNIHPTLKNAAYALFVRIVTTSEPLPVAVALID